MNKRRRSSVLDVRTYRSANCDRDHYLVKIMVIQKISSSVKVRGSKRTKWNTEKLKAREMIEEFQRKVVDHLTVTHNSSDLKDEWKNIKCAIINATSQIIGKKQYKRNEDWFDQKCNDAINAKNEARQKMLQCHTIGTQKEYIMKREE